MVSDFHNHSIKVFDSEGNFIYSFGSSGQGNGQFNAPTGVAVDAQDNIIVADWGNSRIQVNLIFVPLEEVKEVLFPGNMPEMV